MMRRSETFEDLGESFPCTKSGRKIQTWLVQGKEEGQHAWVQVSTRKKMNVARVQIRWGFKCRVQECG